MGEIGKPRPIGITILLTIVTLGIYALYWTYKNFEELKQYSGQGVGGLLGLIIQIFVGIVTPFLMASEVENLYKRENEEPPVHTITGLWGLLPIVGNIIWYVKVQGAINDFWVKRGAPAP